MRYDRKLTDSLKAHASHASSHAIEWGEMIPPSPEGENNRVI